MVILSTLAAMVLVLSPCVSASAAGITVSRGCGDYAVAGCWTGGGSVGDLLFSGVGDVSSSWLYRDRFYAGNKKADIGYYLNGKHAYEPNIQASGQSKKLSGVTGFYVKRY